MQRAYRTIGFNIICTTFGDAFTCVYANEVKYANEQHSLSFVNTIITITILNHGKITVQFLCSFVRFIFLTFVLESVHVQKVKKRFWILS